jgi:hypothetical protein
MIKLRVFLFHLISFLIILNISGLFAQEKMSIGISAQMINTRFLANVANFQTKGAYRPTSIIFTEYDFGKKYCVHTGLGYSMMTQNSDAFRNNFHYLIIPLYFKIGRLKENQRIAFTSFYGANLHYLFKAQHIYLDETQMNIMDQSRKFHFDFVVGGGLKFKLSDNFTLEVLTNFSLGYFVNKRNAANMDINNFNTGLMLNLSYKLK